MHNIKTSVALFLFYYCCFVFKMYRHQLFYQSANVLCFISTYISDGCNNFTHCSNVSLCTILCSRYENVQVYWISFQKIFNIINAFQ